MIISGGFNIYSREVEVILEGNEKVAEAAVIGVPDAQYGEVCNGFCCPERGYDGHRRGTDRVLQGTFASYKSLSLCSLSIPFRGTPWEGAEIQAAGVKRSGNQAIASVGVDL